MYKLDDLSREELKKELEAIKVQVDKYEFMVKNFRAGNDKFMTLEDIKLIEEQLHYMRGYLKIIKIRAYQQGITD